MDEDLNYHKLDEFYNKYMTGELNIHNPIQLHNHHKTKTYSISFLTHVLYLCKKNNMNLLDILNTLKDKLETHMKRLIRENYYIKHYVQSVINEWSLNIEAENIFNGKTVKFPYQKFVDENLAFNSLIGGMKQLERRIKNNDYQKDENVKDTLMLLFTNCRDCKGKIRNHIKEIVDVVRKLEPQYNYLLLDLSNKRKANYLDQINTMDSSNSIFKRLLETSSSKDIPDHIDTIFLNYVLLINFLKKEYHYLITTLQSIDVRMRERHNTLNHMMQGLNINNEIGNRKNDIQQDIHEELTDSDDENNGIFNLF